MMDTNPEIKAAADAVSRFANRYGASPDARKTLATLLANDHPTLQQGVMRLFVAFVQEMAAKPYVDARNERSRDLARQITALWDNDAHGPSLPFI